MFVILFSVIFIFNDDEPGESNKIADNLYIWFKCLSAEIKKNTFVETNLLNMLT